MNKHAKEIHIEPWLQQLEDMASNCDGVDVVVISSGFEEPDERCNQKTIQQRSSYVIMVVLLGMMD